MMLDISTLHTVALYAAASSSAQGGIAGAISSPSLMEPSVGRLTSIWPPGASTIGQQPATWAPLSADAGEVSNERFVEWSLSTSIPSRHIGRRFASQQRSWTSNLAIVFAVAALLGTPAILADIGNPGSSDGFRSGDSRASLSPHPARRSALASALSSFLIVFGVTSLLGSLVMFGSFLYDSVRFAFS